MTFRVIVGLPQWQCNGPTVFAERLVRGLNANGHDAHILITEEDCKHIHYSSAYMPVPADVPYSRLPASGEDAWAQRWEALERYLEERAPCFYIMLHDWRNNVIASRLSNRIHLIGLVQADSELEFNQVQRLGNYWQAIVAVSDMLHFKLIAKLPYLTPKISTIRNAVPSLCRLPLKPNKGPLRLVYSGELRPHQKRLDDLALIAMRLAERGVLFRLTLYGEGSYREKLEKKLGYLIARGCVCMPGQLSPDDLLHELGSHHVFLLTSEYEGLSIAMLEAMSRGCVPVVSQLASQSVIIRPGINALTAKVGNIDDFVDHIESLAKDRSRLSELAAAAFTSIQDGGYRVEDMLNSYINLFRQINAAAKKRGYLRVRMPMIAPPEQVGNVPILPGNYNKDLFEVNQQTFWPSPVQRRSRLKVVSQAIQPCEPLIAHKILISASPEFISGVDVFAINLTRGLRLRGFDARILVSQAISSDRSLLNLAGLPIEVINSPDYLGWPERWRALNNKLSSIGPVIYLPNYDYANSCVAPILPSHVRVIGIGHSDDPIHYEHLCRIGHACDAIVGVSNAITGHLSQLVPELSDRLFMIPYGVANSNYSSVSKLILDRRKANDRLRIVFSGRLVFSQKRAQDVIAIANELSARNVSYEMVIIGDGQQRCLMERMAGNLIINRQVWFTGAQPNDVILKFLESCDVLLLPSSFEGLSISMLEAMSRAVVPVVSSIRSGVPDIITDNENGLVAPVADISAFADRIEWLANNPDALQRIAASAASTANGSYLIDQMVNRYIDLFEQVLSNPVLSRSGSVIPPRHIADELKWNSWLLRIISDPRASLSRVYKRFTSKMS